MKTLYESLLDDEENLVDDETTIIEQFLKDNYRPFKHHINNNIVYIDGDMIFTKNISNLTNNYFKFAPFLGDFYCEYGAKLTSLKGAPEKCGKFECAGCNNLKDLTGAPREVLKTFCCSYCKNLESLNGAPEKCERFECANCNSLKDLTGAPKEILGAFSCANCKNLESLNGAPEKIGGDFFLEGCNKLKNIKHLPKQIGGKITYPNKLSTADKIKLSELNSNK